MRLDVARAEVLRARDLTLQDAVDILGITPISHDDLNLHKAVEKAKYPGHFLARLEARFPEFLFHIFQIAFFCIIISFTGGILLLETGHDAWGAGSAGFTVAGVVIMFSCVNRFRLKGPAKWTEDCGPMKPSMPKEISDLAWTIHRLVPKARFVTGTLVQDMVTLDPYLIMETEEARIVLGIWDDTGIIRIADH